MILKLFLLLSIVLFFALLTGKLFFYTHKNRFIREKSVAISSFLLLFYLISAVFSIFFVDSYAKPIMFICAISPFVIGHFANYEKLLFYTVLQLIVIFAGVVAVIL